jgi:hypothetical protein
MRLSQRTMYNFNEKIIRTGNGYLHIEEREYYTRYWFHGGVSVEIRNCNPLPIYRRQIIYARTIPWFMWIWYGLAGLPDRITWWWQLWQDHRRDKAKRRQILAYQRRASEREFVSKNRFGGRYNR